MKNLDVTLAALADPTRRRVVELLRTGPRRAGELAEKVKMSPPAMSRHLRVLRSTGVVEAETMENDARLRVYRLRREPFVALQAWLDQVQAFWAEQLGSLKAHVDSGGVRGGSRRSTTTKATIPAAADPPIGRGGRRR